MRKVIDRLLRKIEICSMGEPSEWSEGYITGIQEALDLINVARNELIEVGGVYYVIMFRDGNPMFPYVEEMKLFRKSPTKFSFSKNLKANKFNTWKADVVLRNGRSNIRDRVFFTREDAENFIEQIKI